MPPVCKCCPILLKNCNLQLQEEDARGTIITAKKKIPISIQAHKNFVSEICLSFVHNNHQFTTNHDTIRAILISIGLLIA